MNSPLKRLPDNEPPGQPPAQTGMSGTQMLILAGLGLAVVCVLGALFVSVLLNRDLLLAAITTEQTAPQSTLPSTPTPAPTPTATPSPTATSLPLPPTSTPTLVVPPDFINRDKINEITGYVVNIRGLQPVRDVPPHFLTRNQLREYLEAGYTQERISSALDRNQELYIAMDLLDPTTDFAAVVLDSAAQNIAGFYTPDQQVLYLVAESVNMFASEEIVYAHEFTHALQDQHFGLARFLDEGLNADQAIAARALIEGDATLVMDAYQFTEITDSELEYMAYRASFVEREVVDAISPSLGVLTFFPYTQGSYFVYTLWAGSGFVWDRVNAAYHDPPLSSEQVMHPEKYLAGDEPRKVILPDLGQALGEGWWEADHNVLGEIGLLAWLLDHLDYETASAGAAGWDGDEYTLWLDGHGARVLAVRSAWDAPGEAAQFFETFTDYISRRALGVPQLTLNEPGRRIWEYEGRATFLARTGDQVLIIFAPDRPVLDQVRNLFSEF
ncbi:MAG: hypothetical protein Kow0063_08190 [Anaerolineae bacterium]